MTESEKQAYDALFANGLLKLSPDGKMAGPNKKFKEIRRDMSVAITEYTSDLMGKINQEHPEFLISSEIAEGVLERYLRKRGSGIDYRIVEGFMGYVADSLVTFLSSASENPDDVSYRLSFGRDLKSSVLHMAILSSIADYVVTRGSNKIMIRKLAHDSQPVLEFLRNNKSAPLEPLEDFLQAVYFIGCQYQK